MGNGFAGSLNAEGEIEIGYEVAPAHQGQGHATAAARALVAMAFGRPGVRAVVAHTLAQENASTGVLRRIGMAQVAELPHPEVGAVWRWRLAKAG